ncbi:MAG: exosortase A [Kordiimonas sp.]
MNQTILPKHLLSFFVVAFATLTYFWWDIVEHLLNLVINVDAYSHGQLVPVISVWLVWSNRSAIRDIDVFAWLPGLILLMGASVLWLLSEVGEIKILGHVAYITAIQSLILTVLGPNFFQRFLFPCLFLYLAIPMGEGLVPILQDVTAELSVVLLAISGIPYTLDGILITLPSGVYEVAAACAGVRFLFSSFVTGVLLSHLLYQGWKKRLLMTLASLVIPIFANVIRVYGIFLISEATDQSFAREVDHIVYGWGFLSAVLLMVIATAYKFADTEVDNYGGSIWFSFKSNHSIISLGAITVLALLMPIFATGFAPITAYEPTKLKPFTAPKCENCDVRSVPGPNLHDKAIFAEVDAEFHQNYRILADQISVSGALVCPQRKNMRLVQVGNVPQGRGWLQYDTKDTTLYETHNVPFEETVYTIGTRRKYVWVTYYVDGKWMASPREQTVAAALERLTKRVTAGAMLVISSRSYDGKEKPSEMLNKLLSNFPIDSFLWEEIKPTDEGTIVCAE